MTTKKIESATPEQWSQIDQLLKKTIEAQTDRISLEGATKAVHMMWRRLNNPLPTAVVMARSPREASRWRRAAKALKLNPKGMTKEEIVKVLSSAPESAYQKPANEQENTSYLSVWWRAWCGWYRGAEILGVKFGEPEYGDFSLWCDNIHYLAWTEDLVIVSDNPVSISWEGTQLSCGDGMAVRYADGWGLYSWRGVRVTKQIIEAPETITVAQIKAEKNAEVKRIMRERFGEGRYLQESGARLIDTDFEGARKGAAPRALLEDSEGQRWLVGTDGSTERVYYMPVDSRFKTCREAHESICGFPEKAIINKS